MQTVNVISSIPRMPGGPAVLIAYSWDPSVGDFPSQTIPNGTVMTRPSDGAQWTIVSTSPFGGWLDRIGVVLSAPTPSDANPITTLDQLNFGS